jgi:serine O-acetyltransferase
MLDARGKLIVEFIARYNACRSAPLKRALKAFYHACVEGPCSIPISLDIGANLLLLHPVGVVIHSSTKIGNNCSVLQNVTISHNDAGKAAVLHDNVHIGASAVILGAVLYEGASVGAGAIVTRDVPAGMVAVSSPATNRHRTSRF